MNTIANKGSGGGSRPVTDAGVDNIGAADAFTPGQEPGGTAPAPRERMTLKRTDRAAARGDDSAPWGMTDSAPPEANTEPPGTAREANEDDRQ